jgi:hypothetical protein
LFDAGGEHRFPAGVLSNICDYSTRTVEEPLTYPVSALATEEKECLREHDLVDEQGLLRDGKTEDCDRCDWLFEDEEQIESALTMGAPDGLDLSLLFRLGGMRL